MGTDLSTTFTGVDSRIRFCCRRRRRPNPNRTSCARSRPAGAASSPRRSACIRSSTSLGPKTKFLRADADSPQLSMKKRPGAALHSSWNWELISDKTLDWWVPRLGRIKKAFPNHVLVASIMAGSGNDTELRHWQELAIACQEQGCDALELNLSCPHMDRPDMGSNVGKDKELVSIVTKVGQGSGEDSGLGEADAVDDRHRRRGARRVSRRRRRHRLVEHVHVAAADRRRDARLRSARRRLRLHRRPRRSGDPAAVAARRCRSSRRRSRTSSFSGIGGISTFEHALNYFLLGCGTVQVCTAAMLDHAIGPNVISELNAGPGALPREACRSRLDKASTISSACGATASSRSRRSAGPDEKDYRGGYEAEGYAEPVTDVGA